MSRFIHISVLVFFAAFWVFVSAVDSNAQSSIEIREKSMLEGVGFDERPGELVDLEAGFLDHNGNAVTVESFLNSGRPVILNFAYFNCPVICGVMLDQMAASMAESELTLGEDYEVVTVSFSSDESPELAAASREKFRSMIDGEAGWQFLTGSEASITKLATSTGFRFKWIEENGEFAHPAALIFLSDEGKITRYLHGLQYPQRDMKLALVEAAEGRIGNAWDQVVMYCFRFDPLANSYVLQATNLMKLGGLLTVIGIVFMLSLYWMKERSRQSTLQIAP